MEEYPGQFATHNTLPHPAAVGLITTLEQVPVWEAAAALVNVKMGSDHVTCRVSDAEEDGRLAGVGKARVYLEGGYTDTKNRDLSAFWQTVRRLGQASVEG